MQIYDVCLISDWDYDRDLLLQLEDRLRLRGRSTYLLWPENLQDALDRLRRGALSFRYLLDRASNTSGEFFEVYHRLAASGLLCFENPYALLHASDKAVMHRRFHDAGISVPATLILEPYAHRRDISVDEPFLRTLGVPFVIKPANTTGGGVGVFRDGRSLEDVLRLRREYPSDKYLVQETVLPKAGEGRHCWFRNLYATGEVFCCWWDEHTHVYENLSEAEVGRTLLERFIDIARRIARISSLELFTAEIALDERDRLVVVDYVNESPDLRRKSRFVDGVPDEIVDRVIENLAGWICRALHDDRRGILAPPR
jgi:glutathione synthase/RimK-type ligase-like ATP-grasp enzyme